MKIESSTVQWDMAHSASSSYEAQVSLQAWRGQRPAAEVAAASTASSAVLSLSAGALQQLAASARAMASDDGLSRIMTSGLDASASTDESQAVGEADTGNADPRMRLLQDIIERMTGMRLRTLSAEDLREGRGASHSGHHHAAHGASTQAAPARAGWGLSFSASSSYTEQEQTQVQGSAIVHTADGKDIAVNIRLDMSRSYTEQSSMAIKLGDAVAKKDPLVLNFDGQAAQLQSQTFRFDLNGDGQQEDVPMLAGNSGYLAVDLNGNGRVDSGKELFGPATGQGFQELAAYDQDGNGWIDEGDAVFRKLQIWKPGATSLQSAANLGVGAISLDYSASPFELRDSANQSLGSVRSTGMYLMENGSAGTVQQLDLTV